MHANLPDIANRWEAKYGLGGIAELNSQLNQLPEYYLPKNQGGFIPSHEAGIYGLAEGGSITKTPEGQTRGFVQARSDGRRPGYTEDDEDTGGAGHHGGGHGSQSSGGEGDHGNVAHESGGRFDVANQPAPKTTPTPDRGDGPINIHEDTIEVIEEQKKTDEINRQNALRQMVRDQSEKTETWEKEQNWQKPSVWGKIGKGLLTLATSGAGAGVFGKDVMKVASLYNKYKTGKNLYNTLKKGEVEIYGKKFNLDNIQNKLKSSDQKLMESLPKGHPERIALEAKMTVKAPTTDDRDGSSIKIEDIETVNAVNDEQAQLKKYEDMEMAAYRAMVQQQEDRSKQMAAWQMMMKPYMAAQGGRVPAGYNTGGLSNLFRLKNR